MTSGPSLLPLPLGERRGEGRAARANRVGTETVQAYLLILPAVALLAAFTHIPAIATLVESLYTTPRGNRPARFIGLDQYRALLDDPVFWQALTNNAVYAASTTLAGMVIAA